MRKQIDQAKGVLQFQKNWNSKLYADSFVTIAKPSDKYQVGRIYNLYLQGQKLGTVELVSIRQFCLDELSNISALMVTGCQAFQGKKLLKNQFYGYLKQQGPEAKFYFLAFRYFSWEQHSAIDRPQFQQGVKEA